MTLGLVVLEWRSFMHRLKGIMMIVIGALFWGATAPMMEWIFQSDISVATFIAWRLLVAGALIIIALKFKGVNVVAPFRQKVWGRQLVLFGILGTLTAQFAFAKSIDVSSAVIATLFQFLAPIYIIIFVSIRQRKVPPIVQIVGMFVTLIGLFLLLTNGSLEEFQLSKEAVIWGVLVGLTFAFYTLYPVRLLAEWGVLISVGWAMVIGGVTMFGLQLIPILKELYIFKNITVLFVVLTVILVSTVAFILFLGSMNYITPIETSILTSFEPLAALVISAIWFGQSLGQWQLVGTAIMLGGVTWLSIAGNKVREKEFEESLQENNE